ncbi:M15 family metallopeptidase [Oceanobacter mangrovi]|uniref:M15 family metallopeptidase n=1 Tax=Oceanobacter mangrovi TaxID=2862510 RepID=UPI001C8E47BD|nr:M15 family metallopeptidase [Oceanobacter mangrovi]
MPADFVCLDEVIPGLVTALAYASSNNFVGSPVDGYDVNRAILSRPAAEALASVQTRLAPMGLGLKVFDAYRPRRAIDHFLRWVDSADETTKPRYYPSIAKNRLFELGYIGLHSTHCRGSTVDLTIIDLATGADIEMGTHFDYFDHSSWTAYADISALCRANRLLLKVLMEQAGFKGLDNEWWHFTLANEPYPDVNFDFPIR